MSLISLPSTHQYSCIQETEFNTWLHGINPPAPTPLKSQPACHLKCCWKCWTLGGQRLRAQSPLRLAVNVELTQFLSGRTEPDPKKLQGLAL